MKFIVKSYSELHENKSISFTDIGAARLWYDRYMIGDIYKIELIADFDTHTQILEYRER